jgi:hypothetical protein
MTRQQNAPGYEEDFVAWLEDQAQHARRRETDALDLENIVKELEGMARSDRREIRNRLTVLLVNLLKYRFQPRRRASSWLGTIGEQRTSNRDGNRRQSELALFPVVGDRPVLYRGAIEDRSRDPAAGKRIPGTVPVQHRRNAGSGLASPRSGRLIWRR